MRTVYILIGFLGSGKSTWARNFAKEHPDTKIVSADAFRLMLNGEYKYLPELDEIIDHGCYETANVLLHEGYDVIIDCGNQSCDRRSTWDTLPCGRRVAVMMPQGTDAWHVANRLRKPHWDGVDWREIIKGEKAAYEPPRDDEFDEIITVEPFEDNKPWTT